MSRHTRARAIDTAHDIERQTCHDHIAFFWHFHYKLKFIYILGVCNNGSIATQPAKTYEKRSVSGLLWGKTAVNLCVDNPHTTCIILLRFRSERGWPVTRFGTPRRTAGPGRLGEADATNPFLKRERDVN